MSSQSILVVDDELPILNSIRRILRKRNIFQLYSTSPLEALKIIETVEIDVIVSDMRMPEKSGIELLGHCKANYPLIRRIAMSAYHQSPQILAAINQCGVHKYLVKPVCYETEFLPALEECLLMSQLRGQQGKKT